ncbi:MAG: ATP-binding cassette domain-containing protein [Myxococcota bacterium]
MIEFRGLKKRFGDKQVLDGIDLLIPKGSVAFIIGTSGAGKSVLMKHLVGLLRADAGQILFEGTDVSQFSEERFYEVRRRVSYVFQHSTLLDGLDVLDNVALPLEHRLSLSLAEARARAEVELSRLRLEPFLHRYPAELGAGLKKRAAIARSLALEPDYLIYDEPTTGLDPVNARRVDALIIELKSRGITQIVVSHDLASILGVADRVAMIHGGRVHIEGTPAELSGSGDPVIRQFLAGSPDGPIG